MIIKIYEDAIAEVILEDSEYTPDAVDIARALLTRGVTAAKIVRTPQSAEESPRSADCDSVKSTGEVTIKL